VFKWGINENLALARSRVTAFTEVLFEKAKHRQSSVLPTTLPRTKIDGSRLTS
jgi:hypothetical protein